MAVSNGQILHQIKTTFQHFFPREGYVMTDIESYFENGIGLNWNLIALYYNSENEAVFDILRYPLANACVKVVCCTL